MSSLASPRRGLSDLRTYKLESGYLGSRQSVGSLSVLSRLNLGKLSLPSFVRAIYATSTTSFGLTQVTGVGESTEPSTVGVFFSIFESFLLRSSSVLSENPPPTFPRCCSFPSSSYAARISDPKVGTRTPSPSLKPTITQSVVLTCFILIQ